MYQDLVEKKEKLAVIGLGYVGLPIALEFARTFIVRRKKLRPRIDLTFDPRPTLLLLRQRVFWAASLLCHSLCD